MTLSEKLLRAREIANLTQIELAEKSNVSRRTIATYECNGSGARKSTIRKLAKALNVSTKYLEDDTCTNPLEDIEKEEYYEQARALYGSRGEQEMEELVRSNSALFAGGTISQEQKDAFFQAVMTAYITAKEAAKEKYGKKES